MLDKATRKPPCSGLAGSRYRQRVEKDPVSPTTRKINENTPKYNGADDSDIGRSPLAELAELAAPGEPRPH